MSPVDPAAWVALGWDADAAHELAEIERRREIRDEEHADDLADRREGRES